MKTDKNQKLEHKILFLGLDSNEEIAEIYPTPFIKTEKIFFENNFVNLIEISGQIKFRKFWEMFFADVSGIIFVIDGTDEKRLPIVKDLIMDLNKQIHNKMPIQFLINKFDVEGVLDIKTVREFLELDRLTGNMLWNIKESVAFTGLNLRESINHILKNTSLK